MSEQPAAANATDASIPNTPAPAPERTVFKVPVDGTELEVDLEELKRGYSHARAANQRMREAAEIRKKEELRKKRATSGDFSWIDEELGVPEDQFLKWAEKKLLSKIEFDQLPEHEKELRTEKQRREALEKQLEDMTAKERQALQAQIESQAYEQIDDEISKALESYKGKKTPKLIRRVAEAMYASLEANQEPLPAQRALEKARKSLHEDVTEFLNVAPADEIIKMFSKEQLNSLRRHFVNEAKESHVISRQSQKPNDDAPAKRGSKKLTMDEWFKQREQKFGG